jgi:hypothetical protein
MLEWFERVGYSADIVAWNASSAPRLRTPRLGAPPRATKWALNERTHGRPYVTRDEFRVAASGVAGQQDQPPGIS